MVKAMLLFWRMLARVRETGPAPQRAILSGVDAVILYIWCVRKSLGHSRCCSENMSAGRLAFRVNVVVVDDGHFHPQAQFQYIWNHAGCLLSVCKIHRTQPPMFQPRLGSECSTCGVRVARRGLNVRLGPENTRTEKSANVRMHPQQAFDAAQRVSRKGVDSPRLLMLPSALDNAVVMLVRHKPIAKANHPMFGCEWDSGAQTRYAGPP